MFRNLAFHHAASSCLAENCLLCELGYLFDMLEKAEGQKCHATNFLKAFSSLGEGMSFGVCADLDATKHEKRLNYNLLKRPHHKAPLKYGSRQRTDSS